MRHAPGPATTRCRRRRCCCVPLLGALVCGWVRRAPAGAAAAFLAAAPPGVAPPHQRLRRHRSARPNRAACGNEMARSAGPREDDDRDDGAGWGDRVQEFLDRPFFDPDAVLSDLDARNASALAEGRGGPATWRHRFAAFVKNDYETAEAVLVGAYMVALVLLTQELVRYLYHHG